MDTSIAPAFPPSPFPLVEVKWYDAGGDSGGWVHWEDMPHSVAVLTSGYLVHEDEFEVVVASAWYQEEHKPMVIGGVTAVPRNMLAGLRVIEKASENGQHPQD